MFFVDIRINDDDNNLTAKRLEMMVKSWDIIPAELLRLLSCDNLSKYMYINGNFRILKRSTIPYFWPYFVRIFPEI